MKKNIIFLHLPKNGGATFNALLNRLYPKSQIHQIFLKDNETLSTQDFIDLPDKERFQIKVLKGHMYFGLHNYMAQPTEYITFLRHPEKRLLSFYNFVKRKPGHRLHHHIVEQKMTFSEFVKHVDAPDINNAQVRFISGLEDANPDEMLKQALQNIEHHFSFVGLQEYYDESLILLKQKYNWTIPYYKYKNKVSHTTAITEIDEDTRARLLKNNAADIELYNYAKNHLVTSIENCNNMRQELFKLAMANALNGKTFGKRILRYLKI